MILGPGGRNVILDRTYGPPLRRGAPTGRAAIGSLKGSNSEQQAGIEIVLRALEEPLRQIVANASGEASMLLAKVVEGKGDFGYSAPTEVYGDLLEIGILDPTKVTRFALQNAPSIASLILATDVMIAELPKKHAMSGDMAETDDTAP